MSIFDDMWSGVSDIFGGVGSGLGDVGSFLGTPGGSALVRGATTLAAPMIQNQANSNAATQRANASTQAAQIQANAALQAAGIQAQSQAAARQQFADAAARGVANIDQGAGDYSRIIQPLLTPNPTLLPTYRGLTDAQELQLNDMRRSGMATLAASGLRGAGRAGIGALMDQERRFRAGAASGLDQQRLAAMQDAQRRADAARSGLASIGANTGTAKANIQIGQGNQAASSLQAQGNQQAAATQTAGNVTAAGLTDSAGYTTDANLANTGNIAGALGAIGNLATNTGKTANLSRYAATSPI
ncbi:MAG: hypothetical protein RIR25_1080 [Verrucomicrobiota bacterium]|jgi:hypothetical protein